MAGIRYKGQIFSGAASFGDADHVAYDNTQSGLEATDVQGALDEVADKQTVGDWETVSCSYGTIKVRRCGNMVEFWMWSDKAIPTGTVLVTLPSEYRPSIPSYPNDVRIPNGILSDTMKYLLVNNNGYISQTGENSAGQWVEYHAVWFV